MAFVFLQKWNLYPVEMCFTVLNVDWIYRKPLTGLVRWTWWFGGQARAWAGGILRQGLDRVLGAIAMHHRPAGLLGSPWSIGTAAVWAAVLLYAYLVLAYL